MATGDKTAKLALVAAFHAFVAAATIMGKLPVAVLVLYLVGSVIAYVAYAVDKSAAKHGQWRTNENTLHLLSLIGGWPGALVAQKRLRHKSRKASFQIVFWTTVVLNCGALGWLLTTSGAVAVRFPDSRHQPLPQDDALAIPDHLPPAAVRNCVRDCSDTLMVLRPAFLAA